MCASQKLDIKEVDDGIWIVSFMRYDLGYIDFEQKTLRPLGKPFGPRLSPHVLGTFRYHVFGSDTKEFGGGSGIRTHDRVAPIHAFQACAFDRSATPPQRPHSASRRTAGAEPNRAHPALQSARAGKGVATAEVRL